MAEIFKIVSRKVRGITFVNSLVLYLGAFLFIHFSYLLITWLITQYFSIEARIFYYKVDFLVNNQSDLWTVDSLILIFFAGPFFSMILAAIFGRLHFVSRADSGYWKIFYLYVYFHGMNYCFSSILAGAVGKHATWYAMAWMQIPQVIMYILGFIAILLILLTGSAKALFVYESSTYEYPNHPVNRQYWLLNTLFMPWLIGGIILTLIFLPDLLLFQAIIFASPIVLFIPIFSKSYLVREAITVEKGYQHKLFLIPLLFIIIGYVALRFLF